MVVKTPPAATCPDWRSLFKSGGEATGIDIVTWAKRVAELGAGEILLTSKDADGTKEGYDLEMTKAVAEAVAIPVIASGGAGKLEHLYEVVIIGKAAAVGEYRLSYKNSRRSPEDESAKAKCKRRHKVGEPLSKRGSNERHL